MISHDGNQIGVFPRDEALRMAQDQGLDLVEVAADARPPVCRILDFGKYKYEEKKKTRGRKKGGSQMKELRMRPKTEEGDLLTKAKRAREFLAAHHKNHRDEAGRQAGWDRLSHRSSASSNPRGPSRSIASRRAANRCQRLPTRMASSVIRVIVNLSAANTASS